MYAEAIINNLMGRDELHLSAWGCAIRAQDARFKISVSDRVQGIPNTLYVQDLKTPDGLSSGCMAGTNDALRWLAGRMLFDI